MQTIKSALMLMICFSCTVVGYAQKKVALPHGMVYGTKPSVIAPIPASTLERTMGGKIRQTTAVSGKIIKVTKEKGGWFEMDAGAGKVIAAHFANYNVTLPKQLAGRTVIIEGVAQRVLNPTDLQHFAGDTVKGAKEHKQQPDANRRLTFEVQGLMIDK
ncbi:DUF4920 domain-containing protein [Mucilaginibacter glaciei]|uniref:DUF4920 domain-containing protein n=1 Tax=Mucilaginibacter glaciei TaxID=2772109 RepID=A0A926S2E1_9SPHI|nr:DUF4920 domain-containing protein [Mucilaginibacter glaciei]MBD1393747.1 DUF4920 domain-containing protein [Mucilaginibacter glaciei]